MKEAFKPYHRAFVADLLSCVPLLLDLDPPTLAKIASGFRIRKYEKKEKIFSSKDEAREFIIIMNGTSKATHCSFDSYGDSAQVSTTSLRHPPTDQIVGLYSSGDWLNDDALKNNRNNPVDLTAVSDHCLVMYADRPSFEAMLEIGGAGLLGSFERVVSGRLAQSMLKTPLFFGMSSLTSKFATFMHFDEVPAGTTICRQNGKCDGFYIVLHGRLDMTLKEIAGIRLGRDVMKRLVGMNDFFGADWLLYSGGVAQATVTTKSHCVLLRTPAASFAELCETCPLLRTRLDRMHMKQDEADRREVELVKAVEEAVEKRGGMGAGKMSDDTL